jgi:TolA-binding protein
MQRLKTVLVIFLVSLISLQSFAQQTQKELTENKEFVLATKLFDNQKFAAAQKSFLNVIEATKDEQIIAESKFYVAICAVRLFNSDGESLLLDFINSYPENARISQAHYEMGNLLFRNEKYSQAIEEYSLVDMRSFSNLDVSEYFYKSAYSYYKIKDYEKAKPFFREVKDSKSVYAENALFYYSYLEYVSKNYTVALPGFELLADSSMFSSVVPPYICQIYYVYGEYDKLIQYARKTEGVVNPAQIGDVYRVLAGAYYKTLQFDKALPYYEKYFSKAKNPSKSDYYELGYLYYRAGKYNKATKFFKFVTTENDTIASSAYYHLGDCYLKTGDKDRARNAFRAAMDFDIFPQQTEDATFIHAKLIYELSYAPFNEAITQMQAFIAKYPKSKYQNEANSLLVKIFMSSKNYKDALASLEQITYYTTDLKIAYQEIAYSTSKVPATTALW